VALAAFFPQPALVFVFALVTGIALYRDLLIVHTVVALLAERDGVKTYKRKVRNVVIKDYVLTPGPLIVARRAVAPLTPFVHIVFFVTYNADASFFYTVGLPLMTPGALNLLVGVP